MLFGDDGCRFVRTQSLHCRLGAERPRFRVKPYFDHSENEEEATSKAVLKENSR